MPQNKIAITGSKGLANALSQVYNDQHTVNLSRPKYDINKITEWGDEFEDYDIFFNCAYDGWGQHKVLEFYAKKWQHNTDKKIVNIGSNVISVPRSERHKQCDYWPYRQHKKVLEQSFNELVSNVMCDIRLINPGPIDTQLIAHLDVEKMEKIQCAKIIKQIVDQPQLKRVDFWA